jgi:hypothetical protein
MPRLAWADSESSIDPCGQLHPASLPTQIDLKIFENGFNTTLQNHSSAIAVKRKATRNPPRLPSLLRGAS